MARMILKYGGYTHPDTIRIAPDVSRVFTHTGTPYRKVYRYDIDGVLYDSNSTALKSKIDALIAAYASDDLDIHLYYPDGTTDTELTLLASATLYTRVTKPPNIDSSGAPAVYDVKWPYTISIEAVAELPVGNVTVEYDETITIQNATLSPHVATKQPLKGKFRQFDTTQFGACTATQSGLAVGLTAYPTPAQPKWSAAQIKNENDVQYRIRERNAGGNRMFEVSWNYRFESKDTLTI